MNNWSYAGTVPTAPWRGAQSVPRALALRTTPDGIRLVQQPVAELARLRGVRRHVGARAIPDGTLPLAAGGVSGNALDIVAELEPGTASEFGLEVRTGASERTVIGVDVHARQIFVDRTHSGDVAFAKDFAATRQTAPLFVQRGRVRLRVLVDWSSVEVFADDGRVVLTEQIFPAPESAGVGLYAKGGTARLASLDAWPIASAWVATTGGQDGRVRRSSTNAHTHSAAAASVSAAKPASTAWCGVSATTRQRCTSVSSPKMMPVTSTYARMGTPE
jgi:sucrose-6-phosphate hydrolase SacC (GH32 family)